MNDLNYTHQLPSIGASSKLIRRVVVCMSAGIIFFASGGFTSALAMQPQVPTFQTCNKTKIKGRAKVYIGSRSDAEHPGVFGIALEAKCHPRPGYPRGEVALFELNMTDSWVHGAIVATTIDQMTSTRGRSPMAFLSGRCKVRHIGPPVVEPVLPTEDLTVDDQETLDLSEDQSIEPLTHLNPFSGCRYWIVVADNREGDNALSNSNETPDVVGVMVMNGRGRRIAHGMGPVVSGDISVSPSRH